MLAVGIHDKVTMQQLPQIKYTNSHSLVPTWIVNYNFFIFLNDKETVGEKKSRQVS